jgi:tetratricopeptide (TPR) repeat protein
LQSLQNSAVTWLQGARISDGRLSEVYGLLGCVYQAYALMPSAEAAYLNAQHLAPKDYRWAYLLGSVCQTSGRADEAFKHYQRAQELRLDYLPVPVNLGQLY